MNEMGLVVSWEAVNDIKPEQSLSYSMQQLLDRMINRALFGDDQAQTYTNAAGPGLTLEDLEKTVKLLTVTIYYLPGEHVPKEKDGKPALFAMRVDDKAVAILHPDNLPWFKDEVRKHGGWYEFVDVSGPPCWTQEKISCDASNPPD